MKVYIAGKITGLENYKTFFAEAEKRLRAAGHTTMNPTVLPPGFDHGEYMHVCYSMIDVCDAVYLLDNWRDSKGARMEADYATEKGKNILEEGGDQA